MSNGWKQGKTLSNGWTIHTNWMHRTKEYRSPCGVFVVDKLRNGAWRLLEKSTWPDGSPALRDEVLSAALPRASIVRRKSRRIPNERPFPKNGTPLGQMA
jgi:hypothetical protein